MSQAIPASILSIYRDNAHAAAQRDYADTQGINILGRSIHCILWDEACVPHTSTASLAEINAARILWQRASQLVIFQGDLDRTRKGEHSAPSEGLVADRPQEDIASISDGHGRGRWVSKRRTV